MSIYSILVDPGALGCTVLYAMLAVSLHRGVIAIAMLLDAAIKISTYCCNELT